MAKTIAELTADVEQAEATLKRLRQERGDLIVANCPRKVGDTFTAPSGTTYKVEKVTPAPRTSEAWLFCRWMTGSKKWSVSVKTLAQKVEG